MQKGKNLGGTSRVLLQIAEQYAPAFLHKVEVMDDVSSLLYKNDKYGCRTLRIDWPHWSAVKGFRVILENLLSNS
jgi:hypothetical protein